MKIREKCRVCGTFFVQNSEDFRYVFVRVRFYNVPCLYTDLYPEPVSYGMFVWDEDTKKAELAVSAAYENNRMEPIMCSDVLVTVCCITYNHQKYIRRCLDSLLNQNTDFTYEIIVHDDDSTDGTQDIIREYAIRYPGKVIPVLQKENRYSKGIDFIKLCVMPIASGKYFLVCDGDDYWCDPYKLQIQAEVLESHPECSVCVHGTDTADAGGVSQTLHFPDVTIDHRIIKTKEFMKLTLNEGHWLFHQTSFMVRTDLFREYTDFAEDGYPSKFYHVRDLPQLLYFTLKGDMYYIDRVMSVYTLKSGGFLSKVMTDPAYARKVHQGYIDGLTAFDKFSDCRFHEDISQALVGRRFEVDRISRRFDRIIRHPEYKKLIQNRGVFKMIAFNLLGYLMLLFNKQNESRNSICTEE